MGEGGDTQGGGGEAASPPWGGGAGTRSRGRRPDAALLRGRTRRSLVEFVTGQIVHLAEATCDGRGEGAMALLWPGAPSAGVRGSSRAWNSWRGRE